MKVRPARLDPAEARQLLRWENASRRWSIVQKRISWDEHWTWFRKRTTATPASVFIVIANAKAVGSVSLTRVNAAASRIGVIIAPSDRRKGYGRAAIRSACRLASTRWRVRCVIAEIKPENRQSLRAFASAGFTNFRRVVRAHGGASRSVIRCYWRADRKLGAEKK